MSETCEGCFYHLEVRDNADLWKPGYWSVHQCWHETEVTVRASGKCEPAPLRCAQKEAGDE